MKNFNLIKIEFTWRDVLMRVALVLLTVAAVVWFMPRDNMTNFKMEIGEPWHYNDLTAAFTFFVQRSDSAIQADRDSLLRQYVPYYVYNGTTADQQEQLLMEKYDQTPTGLGNQIRRVLLEQLHGVYDCGIIDITSPLDNQTDTLKVLRRIDGKKTTRVTLDEVLTPRQAYEQLMSAPLLQLHRDALQELNLNDFLVPNLLYNSQYSDSLKAQMLDSLPVSSGVVVQGQKIIDRGTIVNEERYQTIQSYLSELNRRHESRAGLDTTIIGEFIYVLLLIVSFTLYISIYRKEYFERMRSIAMLYSLVIIATVMASLLVSHNMLHIYILPLAVVPIFIRVFMDSRTAFMAHSTVVLICACFLQRPLEFIGVEMVAGITAIFSLRELASRSQLFWTAIVTTAAAMATNLALFLIRSGDINRIDGSEYVYLAICGIVIFCAYPLLYIIEKFFGFTSDITLIELSDMNKELLRRMSEVAPGTFQHCIQVGNLAAEIARKIGGNPQLVRTGALYHDIGKMQNPIYFTENQSGGINPHDRLDYIESAQMIIGHVTEGLKLADNYNLPLQIREFIATHHGQGKAKFFYIKYKNEHPDEPVDDLLFTYPGPNPFTKEQAILMMADAVEAASRSLPDYTEQSIRTLVNKIIDSMVDDGFFRECPITFRDIQYAKTVLIEKLKTIYHTRISYPEMKKPSE